MNAINYISQILAIVGALVAVTNIVTEVLKKIIPVTSASLLATIVAMITTMCAFFAYCSAKSIAMEWYYIAGAVVLGIFVAYAAMFGFDKLKEILEKIGK